MRVRATGTGRGLWVGASMPALLLAAAPWLAGEIEPPVPPGTPTMKPLTALEPRRPIYADMLPLTITDRGSSWYFTENITAAGAGISVQADDGTGVGINATSQNGLTIRNGRIAAWTATCVLSGNRSRLEKLLVENCSGSGIHTGYDSIVVDSIVSYNNVHGVIVREGSVVRGCRAVHNTENGIWVEEHFNTVGALVTGCVVDGNLKNGIRIDGLSTVIDNHVQNNATPDKAGIWVKGNLNRVEGNTVVNNNNGLDVDGSYNVITRNMVGGSLLSNFDVDSAAVGNLILVHPIGAVSAPDPWANIEAP